MSVSYSFKVNFNKADELAKCAAAINVLGGISLGLGALILIADAVDSRNTVLEYDARIVQSDACIFSREDGLPLEYNLVLEKVSQPGLRWNAKGHKNDVTDVGRVVQIREFKDGRRSVKGPKVWPFSLFCFGLGALFLYVGISKKIPEAFYWPPAAHIHLA